MTHSRRRLARRRAPGNRATAARQPGQREAGRRRRPGHRGSWPRAAVRGAAGRAAGGAGLPETPATGPRPPGSGKRVGGRGRSAGQPRRAAGATGRERRSAARPRQAAGAAGLPGTACNRATTASQQRRGRRAAGSASEAGPLGGGAAGPPGQPGRWPRAAVRREAGAAGLPERHRPTGPRLPGNRAAGSWVGGRGRAGSRERRSAARRQPGQPPDQPTKGHHPGGSGAGPEASSRLRKATPPTTARVPKASAREGTCPSSKNPITPAVTGSKAKSTANRPCPNRRRTTWSRA